MGQFVDELKRRSVFRVGAAYLAVAWLVLQFLDVVRDILVLPDWIGRFTLFASIIGFPFALLVAWAYEMTPEGVKVTDDVEAPQKPAPFGRLKIDLVIMGALSLVIVLLIVDNYVIRPTGQSVASDDPPMVSDYHQLTRSPVIFPPSSSQFKIVTDGARLYFSDWENGQMGLRQLSVSGGEAIRIPRMFDDESIVVQNEMTPDNAHLLISEFRYSPERSFSLWQWPVLGGSPRKLGKGSVGIFSPDGSRLFYVDMDSSKMYLANADLSEPKLLGTPPGGFHWPKFSPDGNWIRFNVEGPYRSIWEISVEGSDPRRVLPEWEFTNHCCGSWTPDGKYFVFQATRDNRTQIWAVREGAAVTDSSPVQITTGALDFRRPTIGKNGKKIFVFSWQRRGEVVRYDSEIERFVPLPGFENLSAEFLEYSRDEEWLAYVSHPERTLWRSRSDGSQRLQLTDPPMQVAMPQWSPDGQTLAFVGQQPGQDWNIYTIPAEGGTPRSVHTESSTQWAPTWSHDGKTLAFSQRDKDHSQILYVGTGTVTDLKGSKELDIPRWSRNGRYLAAHSEDSLILFNFETGLSETLVANVSRGHYIWANDNQHIYYYGNYSRGPDRSLYRVNINDKVVEKVVRFGEVRTSWGVNGPWVGVDPDGAALLLRDQSIDNIYALDWLPE